MAGVCQHTVPVSQAGRNKHRGIVPPATTAQVRQLRHPREKSLREQTQPLERAVVPFIPVHLYEWEPVTGQL